VAWYEPRVVNGCRGRGTHPRLELHPWPRINASIRALDDSPVGSVGIEIESTSIRSAPTADTAPRTVARATNSTPGLVAEMFAIPTKAKTSGSTTLGSPAHRFSPNRCPDQLRAGEFRFGDTGLEDRFAVRWSGVLHVSKSGEHTLSALHDDGLRVSIDGQPVLFDPVYNPSPLTNRVTLLAGNHDLLVEFYEGSGGQDVFSLDSTGGIEEVIPSSVSSTPGGIFSRPRRSRRDRCFGNFTDESGNFLND